MCVVDVFHVIMMPMEMKYATIAKISAIVVHSQELQHVYAQITPLEVSLVDV